MFRPLSKWPILAAAAALSIGLAACGSPQHAISAPHHKVHPHPTTTTTTTPPPTTTTTSPPPTTTTTTLPSTTLPPTTTTVPPVLSACTSTHLSATLTHPQGTAGTIQYELTLTNTGSMNCSLYGYPGVSFVTGNTGAQIGASAQRIPQTPIPTLTLSSGQSATAALSVIEASNYTAACQLHSTDGFRVYPPNNTSALFIPTHGITTCANKTYKILSVGPVNPPKA